MPESTSTFTGRTRGLRGLCIKAMLCVVLSLYGISRCDAQEAPPEPDTKQVTKSDAELEAEALEALSHIEGLEDEGVTVNGSSAVLTGVADDPAVIERAAEVVQAAAGITNVQNEIAITRNVGERIHGATNRVSDRLQGLIDALPLIPVAIGVVVIALALAWVVGKSDGLFRRLSRNPFLGSIAQRLVQIAIGIAGLLLALEIFNATALVGGVLGAAGVAGIAVGFAFRDIVENYIASILLSIRQPFRPRDHVVIDGHEGLVTSMNSRSTVLTTFDGNIVRIPNALVFKTTIVNYTSDMRRRFEFDVGVGYDVDLAEAIRIGTKTIGASEGVLSDPDPYGIVTTLGDSSIKLVFYGWVDQSRHDYWKVRSAAMQRVKVEFDNRSIDMPEPIYKIRFESDQSQPEIGVSPSGQDQATRAPQALPTPSVSKETTASEFAAAESERSKDSNLLDGAAPSE